MSRRKNLLRLGETLFPFAPRTAMGLLGWGAARLHTPPGRRPEPHLLDRSLLQQLVGPLPPREEQRLLRRNAAARYRGIVLRRAIEHRGLASISGLLTWTPGSRERLASISNDRRGVCFTTWHAGPTLALWAGLAGYDLRLLKFQVGERFPPPPGWEFIDPDQQGGFRAPALKRALRRIREGGAIVVPADMYQWGSRVTWAACLGRKVAFSPAIALLAQLSGAPVVPLFAWWGAEGRQIVLDVQDPLDPQVREGASAAQETAEAMINCLAGRVEHFLRAHPDEYDAHYARMFAAHESIGAPPIT